MRLCACAIHFELAISYEDDSKVHACFWEIEVNFFELWPDANCLRRPYKIQGSDYMKGSLYVRGNNSTVSLLEMPWRPKFDKNSELHFDECIKGNKVLLNRFKNGPAQSRISSTEFRLQVGTTLWELISIGRHHPLWKWRKRLRNLTPVQNTSMK